MRGWLYYKREIRNWWYTILALAFIGLYVASFLGAIGFAFAEIVLWLNFGEYIKVSLVRLLEYNDIWPFFPQTRWLGINKIIRFIMNDTQLWIVLIVTTFIFKAATIFTMEHAG